MRPVPTLPVLVFLGISAAMPAATPAKVLDSFLGRDLFRQRLTDGQRRKLNDTLGKIPQGYDSQPYPWHIWKTGSPDQIRYVVLLAGSSPGIPGGASACIVLLDSAGRRTNIASFEVGWRTMLTQATMEYSSDLHAYLIDISTSPVINGRHIANEYFAVRNDRVQLVRIEDEKGAIVQNSYEFPSSQIGATPEATSIEDWQTLLESSQAPDVLSALVFLGGKHFERDPFFDNVAHETSAQVERYKRAMGDQRIRAQITKLGTSNNKWVREQAALTAEQIGL